MRKSYVKPQANIENYYLSEMISACGMQVTFTTNQGCANNIPSDTNSAMAYWNRLGFFNGSGGSNGCNGEPSSDDMFEDKMCYYGSASSSVFTS